MGSSSSSWADNIAAYLLTYVCARDSIIITIIIQGRRRRSGDDEEVLIRQLQILLATVSVEICENYLWCWNVIYTQVFTDKCFKLWSSSSASSNKTTPWPVVHPTCHPDEPTMMDCNQLICCRICTCIYVLAYYIYVYTYWINVHFYRHLPCGVPAFLSVCLLQGNLTSQVFMYYYLLLDTKTAEKNTSNTKMVMQKI